MTAQDFAYWLKGFFEMTGAKKLTPLQVEMIKKHLELVFLNVTSFQWPITTTPNTIPTDKITIPRLPNPDEQWTPTTVPWQDEWDWSGHKIIC